MLFDYENRTSIKAEKNTGQSVKHITGMVNSGSIKSSLRQLPVKSVCSLPGTSSSGCISAFQQNPASIFRSLRHVDDPETVAAEFGQGFPWPSANSEEIHMHQDLESDVIRATRDLLRQPIMHPIQISISSLEQVWQTTTPQFDPFHKTLVHRIITKRQNSPCVQSTKVASLTTQYLPV
jgi:hypothetical protein